MERIKLTEYVRQISKASGYAQRDIMEVLKEASNVLALNVGQEKETVVMPGVVVYPGHYPSREGNDPNGNPVNFEKVTYPRARFTSAFKNRMF